MPIEWHFVEEIPTTASGKMQKHLLRETRGRHRRTNLMRRMICSESGDHERLAVVEESTPQPGR